MDKFFQKIIVICRSVCLRQESKERIRKNLADFVLNYKTSQSNQVNAEYAFSRQFSKPRFKVLFVDFSRKAVLIPSIIIAVVLAGASASFASQSSMPGDILYGYKVNVSERVEKLLAVGQKNKSVVEMELASRRLEEAARLAAEGGLDRKTESDIKNDFGQSVKNLNTRISAMKSQQRFQEAAEVASQLEGMLKAHDMVLDKVQEAESKNQPQLSELGKELHSAMTDFSAVKADLDKQLKSATNTANLKPMAKKRVEQAMDFSESAQSFLSKQKKSLNATASEEITKKIKKLEALANQSKSKLEAGKNDEALDLANQAASEFRKTKILIKAGAALDLDIVKDDDDSVSNKKEGN